MSGEAKQVPDGSFFFFCHCGGRKEDGEGGLVRRVGRGRKGGALAVGRCMELRWRGSRRQATTGRGGGGRQSVKQGTGGSNRGVEGRLTCGPSPV
jgi:hypothetical protein